VRPFAATQDHRAGQVRQPGAEAAAGIRARSRTSSPGARPQAHRWHLQLPHPALTAAKEADGFTEFLTTFTISVPEGTPRSAVENTEAREAHRARELAGQGHLLRLWILPGESRALGLWRARDPAEMQAILKSLPVDAWMTVETTPLTEHPSDPALTTPWLLPRLSTHYIT
jgi:muconolactone delta-isomerase